MEHHALAIFLTVLGGQPFSYEETKPYEAGVCRTDWVCFATGHTASPKHRALLLIFRTDNQ